MVFTAAQWQNWMITEMGVPADTIPGLEVEGITNAETLAEYNEELLKALKDDLRRPPGTIPDPNWVAPPQQEGQPALVAPHIPRPGYVLSPILLNKWKVAADLIRYYIMVGREINPAAVAWNGPCMHYQQYMKACDKAGDEDEPQMPKITKNLGITLWVDAFELYLQRIKGCRDVPLAYVVRSIETPPAVDARVTRRPYGASAGSVNNELIARASHTHEMFVHDNNRVYDLIEEALRTTQYSSTLAGFKRAKNGRGVWRAILAQHVGRDKWEKECKKHRDFITTYKWKGTTNMTLESFVNKHRIAHTRMVRCSENITVQVFAARERVNYLLDGIITSDAGLQAAMASIRADTPADGTGKQDNFEDAAVYIIPFDPVSKRRGVKRQHDIAAVKPDLNIQRGSTGVELRFYKPSEYKCLSKEQKEELRELRTSRKKGSTKKSKNDKGTKAKSSDNSKATHFLAAVTDQLEQEESSQDAEYNDRCSLVIAAMNDSRNDPTATAKSLKAKGVTVTELKSILKRNGKDVNK